MDDKEYKTQKIRVKALFDKWRSPLGIGWWKVELYYSREKQTDELAYAPADIGGKFQCVFDVHADYYYKTAVITAYLPVVKYISDSDLQRYFIHELMHIHLQAMHTKEMAKEEELVATSLADAVLWVVEAVEKKDLRLRTHRKHA